MSVNPSQPRDRHLTYDSNNTNASGGSTGGLFGSTTTNSASGGTGLFGQSTTNQNTQSTGGLFGNTAASNTGATNSGGLFGNANSNTGGLFGNLGNTNTNKPAVSTSIFGAAPSNAPSAAGLSLGGSTAQTAQIQSGSNTAIDLAHVRSTTKFDVLQQALQDEISKVDQAILNQQNHCREVGDLLPKIQESVTHLAPAIEYVSHKMDELESGLENDALAIVNIRDGEVRRDEGEAKCVFRNIDRLKVPRQYQIAGSDLNGQSVLGASGNSNVGLSGWWNQPQTVRGARSTAGQSIQLVTDDKDESREAGPKTLVELFDNRTEDFKTVGQRHERLLAEIETFLDGLEDKVITKERELNERLSYSNVDAEVRRQEEKDRMMNQLKFVFGEVQRGLYDTADSIGGVHDGVQELASYAIR